MIRARWRAPSRSQLDVEAPRSEREQFREELAVVHVGAVGRVLVATGAGVDADPFPLAGREALQHPLVELDTISGRNPTVTKAISVAAAARNSFACVEPNPSSSLIIA